MPLFPERNLKAKDAMLKHAKEHLHKLNGKLFHDYIHSNIFPETAKTRIEEIKEEMRGQ